MITTVANYQLAALALATLLLSMGCKVETIEVGSRLDEAREKGEVPEKSDQPGLLTGAAPDQVIDLALSAEQRNLKPESLDSLLKELGIPEPIREDAVAYLTSLKSAGVSAEDLPVHAAHYVLERHDPGQAMRSASDEELLQLGLAFALEDDTLLKRMLVDVPESRMLHCHHPGQPDLLMSTYATQVVTELKTAGYSCRPVALGK